MKTRSQEIESLIEDEKLDEAFEYLKSNFSPHNFNEKTEENNEVLALLYTIIAMALDKNHVILAANAAIYGLDFNKNLSSKNTLWNPIIRNALKLGELPKLDIPTEFLTPSENSLSPLILNLPAVQIWEIFKDNEWNIPGYDVIFNAYGRGAKFTHSVLAYKVEEIRGKNFILGFNGDQDQLYNYGSLNNSGAFSFIAISQFAIKYTGNSGPEIFTYKGNDWLNEISKLDIHSSFTNNENWKKIDCSSINNRELFVKTLLEQRNHYIDKAVDILQTEILPEIFDNLSRLDSEAAPEKKLF